jgi:hypothetical protein
LAHLRQQPYRADPFQWFWDTCFHIVMLARLGEFDLAKRNLRSLFAMQKENGFVGHMILWKQVRRASHADGIRRERCGCIALRSVPTINDLPRLAALEELDQIALLT